MIVEVNWLTVLIAAVVSMGIGFFWYSPMLFGKPWMKLMGLSKSDMKGAQKQMGMMYGLSFVATLITAFVLTHSIAQALPFYGMGKLVTGLMSGFWAWAGFIAPVQMTDVIFGGKKWSLFAINTGYQLASVLAMGLVLGLM